MLPTHSSLWTVLLALFCAQTNAFEISSVSPNQTIHEGGAVRLQCRSDSYFEFCIWRHHSNTCEFEWKRATNNVTLQRCSPSLSYRIEFVGDYNNHECEIELSSLTSSDAGEWSCEMEDYVWGAIRGATHKRSVHLEITSRHDSDHVAVEIVPETTTFSTSTTATNETSSDADSSTGEEGTVSTIETTEATTESHSLSGDIFDKFKNVTDDDDQDVDPVWDQQAIDGALPNPRERGTGDDAILAEEDPSSSPSTVGLIGLIVGIFCACAAVILVAVFLLRRRRRKAVLESDWKERRESGKNRVETTGIIEDQDDLVLDCDADQNPATPIVKIDVESQRMTYHGSRSVSYDDDNGRPSSNKS